jgi:hypothetical protein
LVKEVAARIAVTTIDVIVMHSNIGSIVVTGNLSAASISTFQRDRKWRSTTGTASEKL